MPLRTHQETVQLMLNVAETNMVTYGVERVSPLINLSVFDIVLAMGPDYMHFICEGFVKDICNLIEEKLSVRELQTLDETLENLAVPKQIARLSSSFSNRINWKAREWENFVLYYSVPVFSKILSPRKLSHWLLLVNSFYTLLQVKNYHSLKTCIVNLQ